MSIRASYPLFAIALGAVLVAAGAVWLSNVGALSDRTELATALMSPEGTLRFTTTSAEQITVALGDNCKRRTGAPPGRRCVEYLQPGDEVLLRYDTSDPTHVWRGSTPSGGSAAALLYAGISLITVGTIGLWYVSGVPRRLRRLALLVAGSAGRADGDIAHRVDS